MATEHRTFIPTSRFRGVIRVVSNTVFAAKKPTSYAIVANNKEFRSMSLYATLDTVIYNKSNEKIFYFQDCWPKRRIAINQTGAPLTDDNFGGKNMKPLIIDEITGLKKRMYCVEDAVRLEATSHWDRIDDALADLLESSLHTNQRSVDNQREIWEELHPRVAHIRLLHRDLSDHRLRIGALEEQVQLLTAQVEALEA
jgi:hypothetical protein